jgi:O-antigen ligase
VLEGLTFNHGAAAPARAPRRGSAAPVAPGRPDGAPAIAGTVPAPLALPLVGPDLAFWGTYAFTALLFFRPQDTFAVLAPLHLAEVTAIVALAALGLSRLSAGLPLLRYTPELAAVIGLAVVMVATAPFSVWPGGAIMAMTDVYLKVALIFILLTHSARSPALLRRLTWLIVLTMGYTAFRGCIDYVRGVNLVEDGRLGGATSGLMGNPNDLAMNMVTFLPFAIFAALGRDRAPRRLLALGIAVLMLAVIVFTKSRAGMLGLAVTSVVMLLQAGRFRTRLVAALLVASLVAVPLLPDAFWTRLSSIVNQEEDATGSRQNRKDLMLMGWQTFLDHPFTGVGVNQFRNYNPPERVVTFQETHNVVLQVLAELGIFGGAIFAFLMVRPIWSLAQTKRRLPRERPARRETPASRAAALAFTPLEAEWMRTHVAASIAGFAGWFTCAQFASIGYYWTFYYLLALVVAAHAITMARTHLVRRAAAGETGAGLATRRGRGRDE